MKTFALALLLAASVCGAHASDIVAGVLAAAAPKTCCAPKAAAPSCCAKELPASEAFTDSSLYNLDSQWTNDRGQSVRLSSFKGKPVFVTMFFAQCAYACPILVRDTRKIEAALDPALRKEVQFVFVTFDTERDTVEALAAFRKTHNLGANYHLLRGSEADVQELAMLLGVKYVKENNGQFAHSNLTTLLNHAGEIVFTQNGLNRPPDAALLALGKLKSAPHH